jgi:uncharacterized membrane protein YcaP (DUF421 family)
MHSKLWGDMFVLTLPIAEKILRPAMVYGFLIVGLRLAGKRELAQLNPFDLVVLLTISNTVQNAIIGEDNSVTGGIIGAAALLGINYIVVRFLFGHARVDRILGGDADVLVENGKIKKDRLKKELITLPELKAAAHRQGFASLDEIDRVILEPGGTLCFIRKEPPPEEARHAAVMARLDEIGRELARIRSASG